ncbi:MAG: hypothetical protein ACR2IP_14635 [Solirubrobacteraceae bacterium]
MPTGQGSAAPTATGGSTSTTTSIPGSTVAPTASGVAPPTPGTRSGTPAPPAGLAAATGYGTYERCSDGCSGGAPASLRHPLHLPSPPPGAQCPVSTAAGPVKPLGSAQLTLKGVAGSSWAGARVIWTADPSYEGPVLIRGRELGGPGAVGFGSGRVPYDELQLSAPGAGAATPRGTGREWFTFTRTKGPGCYSYQVDGTGFSTVIVFRVTE